MCIRDRIDIAEKQLERTFKRVPVEATGLQDTQSATLSAKTVNVTVKGPYRFMQSLKAEDIALTVDLTGLADGEYQLDVQCHIANAPAHTCELSLDQVTATVKTP